MSDESKLPPVYNIPIVEPDIKELIDILNFAQQAASMLAHQEIKNPNGITTAAKYNRMSRNAKDLAQVFSEHLDVGEPTDGQIH